MAWLAYCSLRWGVGRGTIHYLPTGPGLTLALSRRRVPLCFLVAPEWRGPRRSDCQGGTTCSASSGWYWTNASWFSVGNHKIRKVIISPNTQSNDISYQDWLKSCQRVGRMSCGAPCLMAEITPPSRSGWRISYCTLIQLGPSAGEALVISQPIPTAQSIPSSIQTSLCKCLVRFQHLCQPCNITLLRCSYHVNGGH